MTGAQFDRLAGIRRQEEEVLTLLNHPLRDALWDDDLNIVAMGTENTLEAVRRLEIFLDRVLFEAGSSPAYLMDRSFDGLLNDAERAFRDELKSLKQRFSDELEGSAVWHEYRKFLERLGHIDPE